jgi:hypothetical protein
MCASFSISLNEKIKKMMQAIRISIIKRDKRLISEREEDYELGFLNISLFDEVIALQDLICRSLPDREIFRRSTAEFIRELL